jgi:hypothetical protein
MQEAEGESAATACLPAQCSRDVLYGGVDRRFVFQGGSKPSGGACRLDEHAPGGGPDDPGVVGGEAAWGPCRLQDGACVRLDQRGRSSAVSAGGAAVASAAAAWTLAAVGGDPAT